MTSPLGDELVKQNGVSARVDAELGNLRQIVEAERQRARRLARWTKIVWLTAVALLFVPVLLTGVYMALARDATQGPDQTRPAATQPTTTAAHAAAVKAAALKTQAREKEARTGAVAAVIMTLFFVAIPVSLVLIVIGIVLMVMTFVARRTAGMHEIRASLASIDAQLRMMSVKRE